MKSNIKQNKQELQQNPTENKIVRFDWAIKNLLRNKANFDILEGFLSELLKEQIIITEILESEANKDTEDAKFNRVDMLVKTATGEKIIVEVQTASEWDFWHRILFGTSKVITQYIEQGNPYENITKVISVSILFFELGSGKDYVYKGITEFKGVHNNELIQFNQRQVESYLNKGYEFPSDIFPTYYLIQLNKFANIIKDKFDEWVYLLKNEAIKSSFTAQGVMSASKKLDILKLPKVARQSYDKFMENISFEASLARNHHIELDISKKIGIKEGVEIGIKKGEEIGIKKGEELGIKKGVEKGMHNKALEIAKKLLDVLDDGTIAIKTGLSVAEVRDLRGICNP